MSGLFPPADFTCFGPSAYLPDIVPHVHHTGAGRSARLRTEVRLLAPNQPGVYGMLDAHQELIYIGKAKNLRARLYTYFRSRTRPPKAGKVVAQTRRILWETCPGEFASLLRELELIRRWRPRFNVYGQPLRRRHTFVCLGRAPAPYAFLSTDPPRTASAVFGPIPAGARANEAVRRVNDCFQLRDCPHAVEIAFPDQGELFPQERVAGCMRLELGLCTGPCTGRCSRAAYHTQCRYARAFLAGTNPGLVHRLQQEMDAAAALQQYERAAALRDRIAPLQWLAARLETLRCAREKMSFVYPVTAPDGTAVWYLIHGARTLAGVPAPTDAASKERARQAIDAAFRTERASWLRDAYEHADGMMLVLAWFRKHPAELKRTLSASAALWLCA